MLMSALFIENQEKLESALNRKVKKIPQTYPENILKKKTKRLKTMNFNFLSISLAIYPANDSSPGI